MTHLARWSRHQVWLRAAGWGFVGQALVLLPTALLLPALFLVMPANEYAAFAFGMVVVTVAIPIVDLGTLVSGTHATATATAGTLHLTASIFQTLRVLTGMAGSFGILIFASLADVPMDYRVALGLMSIAVPFYMAMPTWFFRGIQDIGSLTVINAACRLTYALVSISLAFCGVGAWGLAVTYSCFWVVQGVATYWLLRRRLKVRFIPRIGALRKCLLTSLPFALGGAGWTLLLGSLILTLGLVLDEGEFAIAALIDQSFRACRLMRDTIAEALMPHAARDKDPSAVLFVARVMGAIATGMSMMAIVLISAAVRYFEVDSIVAVLALFYAVWWIPDTLAAIWSYPLFAALGLVREVNVWALSAGVICALGSTTGGIWAASYSTMAFVPLLCSGCLAVSLRLRARHVMASHDSHAVK